MYNQLFVDIYLVYILIFKLIADINVLTLEKLKLKI